MELHTHLEQLDPLDVNLFAISKDSPNELKRLSDAMKESYPRDDEREIIFLSDPSFELIEAMNMRDGDTAYRGYGLLDQKGETVFVQIDDHFGEELDKTILRITEELKKVQRP
ncbi:hypothetical protein EIZ39_04400 [Ammoniphilus sp. CFH 90114]|nr:hypothetical protein EIZ39_04400 [Ammoniphilus sp. CFH 90114]